MSYHLRHYKRHRRYGVGFTSITLAFLALVFVFAEFNAPLMAITCALLFVFTGRESFIRFGKMNKYAEYLAAESNQQLYKF